MAGSAPLALVFATLQRAHTAQRLINSVRRSYPDMPIYVADQSEPTEEMQDFYDRQGCDVVWMEFDAGVCASRNAAVARVKEPYFLLCDDDFYFGPETSFDAALALLAADPQIGIVGGRLFDRYVTGTGASTENRFWELLLNFDPAKGKLTSVPVHYFAPDPREAGGVTYYDCDAVMNFAVFRTDLIDETIRWDPRFKSNGEHEDFYLNFKVNGRHRVVYTPQMVAYHNHPPQPNYQKLRSRKGGWQVFLDKWGLRQFLELDGGLRVTHRAHEVQPYATGYAEHYDNAPLQTRTDPPGASCLRISNVTGRPVPAASAFRAEPGSALSGHLRIGLDGSGHCAEGRWTVPAPPRKPVRHALSRQDLDRLDFRVKWPPSFRNGMDDFVYLDPRWPEDGIVREIPGIEVRYSLAIGADYLVFLKPVMIDSQCLLTNQWNALYLGVPPATTDLVAELAIVFEGRVLKSFSQRITSGRNDTALTRKLASPAPV